MIANNKRNLMLFISVIMIIGVIFTNLGSSSHLVYAEEDLVNRVLCRFEDGRKLANMHSTDYFHYLFRSKSAMTSTQGVNSSWLNKMLSVAGYDFNTPNEVILGRPVNPSSLTSDSTATANGGPKVSAFDRFGVAGLTWSSYQGEWKYNHVDVCANQNQVSPTNYGSFYEGRLEPKSTHNEVPTSKDPRTIQFNKGTINLVFSAARDFLANGLFGIAKFVVTLTIAFVGLAFTDITTLMGLSIDGTSGPTAANIFMDLFDTIFIGFVVFAFLSNGIYILYKGLIKRELRLSINAIIKTTTIFIVTIIMSTNPSYWIGVPNKVATYGQALVLGSMAGMYNNDSNSYPTLCSTEVASIEEGLNIANNFDETSLLTEFEKVNKNMQSLIGCQMWEQLLFKPWVRGQFGVDYEDLASNNVDNINTSWVGNAGVPLGGGVTINNWALFHLSTQTDAHAQIGTNNFPTIVTGVNADWWRTADALSNYDESQVTDSIGEGAFQGDYVDQVNSNPLEFWNSWVGNNSIERLGSAIIAIFFAIVGSIAPMIFALSSAVFGFGITLLMMLSPLFLLFGTWAGKGSSIFLGWLSALINTIIKRIGVSILLILSITMTMKIMDLAYEVGIIKSFVLMIIVTMLLVKNKDKMLDMLASVDFGGAFDPREKAGKMFDKKKKTLKSVGKIGLATGAGMKAGIKTGQGAMTGAKIGARSQLRNTLYQSQLGMNVIRELDIVVNDERSEGHICTMCLVLLGDEGEEIAYRDDNGNYYCIECADEIGIENLYEVVAGITKDDEREDVDKVSDTRTVRATKSRSYLSHSKTRDMMNSRVINGRYYWDDNVVQQMAKDNIKKLREDTIVFTNMKFKLGVKSRPPAPPEPLQSYIDIALLNKAWTDGRTDAVENTYKEAWKMWYEDNATHAEGVTQEDIDKFKEEIEEYNPDISHKETVKILKKDMNLEHKDKSFEDRDLYIYKNGKLTFNIYDKKKYDPEN